MKSVFDPLCFDKKQQKLDEAQLAIKFSYNEDYIDAEYYVTKQ